MSVQLDVPYGLCWTAPTPFYYTIAPKNIGNIQLILYLFSIDGVNKKESYLSEHLYNKYLAVKDILKGSHTQKIRCTN